MLRLVAAFALVALLPAGSEAGDLNMSPNPLILPLGCGLDSRGPLPDCGIPHARIVFLSGDSVSDIYRFAVDGSGTGYLEDSIGFALPGGISPLDEVDHNLFMLSATVVDSTFDDFEIQIAPGGDDTAHFYIHDLDGSGSATIEIHLSNYSFGVFYDSAAGVFFNNTGSPTFYRALARFVDGLPASDADGDGIPLRADNCSDKPNANQADRDLDGIGDVCDPCPDYRHSYIAERDHNGIGDLCECGDENHDGLVTVPDLIAINRSIFLPSGASPLCDTNYDGKCNVQDIVGANLKIFGHPAYCSRYPPPGP